MSRVAVVRVLVAGAEVQIGILCQVPSWPFSFRSAKRPNLITWLPQILVTSSVATTVLPVEVQPEGNGLMLI